MNWVLGFLFLGVIGSVQAQDKGSVYGNGVTEKEVTMISTILDDAGKYVGKTVAVEGTIVDVCPKRGCWMDLASDKAFQKIRIKVTDGEIVFPLDAKGKKARAQGVVEAIEMSREDAIKYYEHLAEEKGEKFDPSTVNGPVTLYRIKGTGATIQ